jgi:hypothetical protein
MVLKYDDFGAPYHEPPYTDEEDFEFWRRMGGVSSFPSANHRRAAAQSPQEPEQKLPKAPSL